MHGLEKKAHRDDRFLNPSFSSTLLDKIYRSMDEGERKSGEMKFYRETTTMKKQNRSSNNVKCNRNTVEEEQAKRKDKKVGTEKPCFVLPTHHHGIYHRDHDQDAIFFSSTSISSDSSSGGFSSSDTESSMYGAMSRASRASCFAPPPKPNSKPVVKKKNIEKQKQTTPRMFDGFCHNSKTEGVSIHDDDDVDDEKALFKSKLRALKIYNNLKKVKQPISPGGRLTSFLNSLFANNAKKTRTSSSSRSCYYEDMNTERKVKVQASSSACSSASSFSRSCLSKTSSCEREKMFNGVKRTVSFQPVNVSVDEEEGKSLKGLNLKIGRSNSKKKKEEESKLPVLEKSRVVEEAAREFLEEYHHNRKSDLPLRSFSAPFETVATAGAKRTIIVNDDDEGDDDDDDAASYASSDLFELDHLAVLGNGRYCEELPVYETTHVSTNRAIVNGLVM